MAPEWIDLIDPGVDDLRASLPESVHESVLDSLVAAHEHGREPRPRIDSHGDYIIGMLLVPVTDPDADDLVYQELDFIATEDRLVSISKTPPDGKPFDPKPAKEACREHEHVGMYAFHLVDEVAERFLDLIDDLDDEIDDLEDKVTEQSIPASGRTLRELRHEVLGIRRVLGPTRDAVRKIVDNRIELDSGDLFPRNVEISFGNAYDKLLRAYEALDSSRDALSGVRDFVQGRIAYDQNEVTKRLTVIASLLLVPTFIVGVYGQNFREIPELHWGFGYAWSWGLIILTTLGQLAFFRWKRWI
ncbi:MAG TPA: CorA family divalent cation transporter [Gaiellaceae bacterium]|nr:CorA family divalent cation transporter [Gaiellaceae bacterium]